MQAIETYLYFNGNCEQALDFYVQCLGGSVPTLMRYEGAPMEKELPPEWKRRVMHAHFQAEGTGFMAGDVMPGQPAPQYGGFAISLFMDDLPRAEKIFNALAEGGQVTMPFAPPFWGGHFGMLTDKFGVPWMVSVH